MARFWGMRLTEIETLPASQYTRYRDHFRDHLDYQSDAIEEAKQASDSD